MKVYKEERMIQVKVYKEERMIQVKVYSHLLVSHSAVLYSS